MIFQGEGALEVAGGAVCLVGHGDLGDSGGVWGDQVGFEGDNDYGALEEVDGVERAPIFRDFYIAQAALANGTIAGAIYSPVGSADGVGVGPGVDTVEAIEVDQQGGLAGIPVNDAEDGSGAIANGGEAGAAAHISPRIETAGLALVGQTVGGAGGLGQGGVVDQN